MSFLFLLTYLVSACYAIMLLLLLFGCYKVKQSSEQSQACSALTTKVSIILPVRNEEKNIPIILHHLSLQDYPRDKYEIILVDDFSADATITIARQQNISNLKIICEPGTGGKKQAITKGIQNAMGTLMVTTDADCEMGEKWLSSIVNLYEVSNPKMIISPVLLKGEKTWMEKMQGQEMTVLTAVAGASAYFHYPLLCSGANLAYEKQVFEYLKGFEGDDKTLSGDDMFLMMKVQSKFPKGIYYLGSNDAAVYTQPERTSSSALRQRKRWASKIVLFKFRYVTVVSIVVFLANFLIFIAGIMSFINVKFALAFPFILFIKIMVDFILFRFASMFFRKKMYPILFLFASVLYPFYVTMMGVLAPFTQYTWKGRQS